jgi:phage-related protein
MSKRKTVVLNPKEQIIVSWDESCERQENKKTVKHESYKYKIPSASEVLKEIDRNAERF